VEEAMSIIQEWLMLMLVTAQFWPSIWSENWED
jgi:hypothetical protein